MKYPYSDDYMTFDESTNRYVLTSKYALEQFGIDLLETVNDRNAVNQQIAVNGILKQVSNQIYNYIHKYNVCTDIQDLIIAKIPSARNIIKEAMSEQFLYVSMKGYLSRSTDKEKRMLAIDENAKGELERLLPELGICILYTGDLRGFAVCLS